MRMPIPAVTSAVVLFFVATVFAQSGGAFGAIIDPNNETKLETAAARARDEPTLV